MVTTMINVPPLRLDPIAGPALEALDIPPGKPVVLGRSSTADRHLTDETVSRRHVEILCRGGEWFVTDLQSRHGTALNGVGLVSGTPAPLRQGDLLTIGPWTFATRLGGITTTQGLQTTTDDLALAVGQVKPVPEVELAIGAQAKLDFLLEASAQIASAASEQALAGALLKSALKGTGFTRASYLKPTGSASDFEVFATEGVDTGGDYSRSLLRGAASGHIVRMDGGAASPNFGQSIIQLGIHAALCAPVGTGNPPAAFLYLDARRKETTVSGDAAGFCQALTRMAGMSLSNLRRNEIERRQKELESDLRAAHAAQVKLMPPARGKVGGATYAVRSIPGRYVAGDLFDVFETEDGHIAWFLGDVAGKGVGAAMLMATAQAHLNATLRHHADPARAANLVTKHLESHCEGGRFVTAWIGVLDPKTRELRFVDAGHGLWALVSGSSAKINPSREGGIPLGVDSEFVYTGEKMVLGPGERVVVYSDGVAEQTSPEGEQFGQNRVAEALAACIEPAMDVERLASALLSFTAPLDPNAKAQMSTMAPSTFADDVTIASVAL